MNREQFRHDLRRGLGSCYAELKQCGDPEKYRADIFWGCDHAFAYDAQSEGVRGPYLFGMIKLLGDYPDFCELAEAGAKSNLMDTTWRFEHYISLLTLMADAYEPASKIVWEIYQILLHELRTGGQTQWGTWPAYDHMSYLCVLIFDDMCGTDDERAEFLLKVFSDYGDIMRMWPHLKAYLEDGWLEAHAGEVLGKNRIWKMLEENQSDPNLYCYLEQWKKNDGERRTLGQLTPKTNTEIKTAQEIYKELQAYDEEQEPLGMIQWTRRLEKTGDTGELTKLIEMYGTETDGQMRYRLLFVIRTKREASVFDKKGIARVISDMDSESDRLKEEAARVLSIIRDDSVRQYAIDRINRGVTDIDTISILIGNYQEGDGRLLAGLIRSISADETNDFCHGMFGDILDLIDESKEADNELSDVLLPYLYHEGNCSGCRRRIVEHMKRRGILTLDIIEQCLYDCNEEIREIASKWMG